MGDKLNAQSRSHAISLTHLIMSFSIIISFVIIQYTLEYTRPLFISLQPTHLDLFKAHKDARNLLSILKKQYEQKFSRAVIIANSINVQPTQLRITRRQRNRSNAPSPSIEDNYRINLYLTFVHHILESLDSRFSEEVLPAT